MIIVVGRESADDVAAVDALLTAAFGRRPRKSATPEAGPDTGPSVDEPVDEAALASRLRADAGWVPRLTMVAEVGGIVAGQVMCSRGVLNRASDAADLPIVGVGPVAVDPRYQGRGIGSAMMHALVGAADALDEPALVLLGAPGYYARFGFVASTSVGILPPDDAWASHFQIRTLGGFDAGMVGRYRYAAPFDDL